MSPFWVWKMAVSREIEGHWPIYIKSHNYEVFSKKGKQRPSANWQVQELKDRPWNLNFMTLYRLNESFFHVCNQSGNFVSNCSRLSTGFKYSRNKHTLFANCIKRNIKRKRFLICICIEIQHHLQSEVVLFEDNMSLIPHSFIAIQEETFSLLKVQKISIKCVSYIS